ncbi:MAG: CDGSH iron-sulfur domain-containing protein [Thermoleophilia bacterium]
MNKRDRGGVAVSDCSMQVLKDGPLRVKGRFDLRDANGRPIPVKDGSCMLCRCGESKTKPFYDGSHIRAGFKD